MVYGDALYIIIVPFCLQLINAVGGSSLPWYCVVSIGLRHSDVSYVVVVPHVQGYENFVGFVVGGTTKFQNLILF